MPDTDITVISTPEQWPARSADTPWIQALRAWLMKNAIDPFTVANSGELSVFTHQHGGRRIRYSTLLTDSQGQQFMNADGPLKATELRTCALFREPPAILLPAAAAPKTPPAAAETAAQEQPA